ncbi:hypothetical protein RJ639_025140, partial [Escallonia herrerae]
MWGKECYEIIKHFQKKATLDDNYYFAVDLVINGSLRRNYELIPYYKGENTVFDVSPPFLSVSVQHDHAIVPRKFQVTRFSVGGCVVDANGRGVDGVKIIVDGHERSVTDKKEYYKLDQ